MLSDSQMKILPSLIALSSFQHLQSNSFKANRGNVFQINIMSFRKTHAGRGRSGSSRSENLLELSADGILPRDELFVHEHVQNRLRKMNSDQNFDTRVRHLVLCDVLEFPHLSESVNHVPLIRRVLSQKNEDYSTLQTLKHNNTSTVEESRISFL